MNYYDEILDRIEKHIKNKEFDEANALLYTELNMPYIPLEFERKLKELRSECKEVKSDSAPLEISESKLEEYLFSEDEYQLIAVGKLNTLNLRNYVDLIRKYLLSNPNPSAAALLIDSCIEQKIDELLTYQKDLMEFEFIPSYCCRPFESSGFNEAQLYLKEWFESNDPSFCEFCMQQLIHECFNYLPLSYDTDEGYQLAKQTVKMVLNLMDRIDEWENIEKKMKESINRQINHLLS